MDITEKNWGDKLEQNNIDFQRIIAIMQGYIINYNAHDYNVHFTMSENVEKEYILQGMVDFNEKTENKITGITEESCDRIFWTAKKYFEEEILELLNKNGI